MSEAKFTKGPWVVEFNDVWYAIKGVDGEWISDTCASSCKGNLELGECNAHLIAAAPEMYEFLENMKSYLNECCSEAKNKKLIVEATDKLLAKARGETA